MKNVEIFFTAHEILEKLANAELKVRENIKHELPSITH